jgi:hypothetical protein
MVVNEIVAGSAVQLPPASPGREKWEREQRAFYRLLGGLLQTHRGQYVAIHNENVVAAGSDLVDVALRAYAKYGREPMYVDIVMDHPLPPVHLPHYRQPSRPE